MATLDVMPEDTSGPPAAVHTLPTGHFPLLELSIEACLNP